MSGVEIAVICISLHVGCCSVLVKCLLSRVSWGIVIEQFLCLFLCQQHYEKMAGLICMKFSGQVWSDHGTT